MHQALSCPRLYPPATPAVPLAVVIVVPAHCFTDDYYSLMELLEEIPPECKYMATSSASQTPDVKLPIGFKMKLWDGFRQEVMNDIYAEDLHALLESRRVLRHPRE